jgi:hypothetical protein
MDTKSGVTVLTSEFASVEVERDDNANGPRLKIRDVRNGKFVFLDPLELAALVWVRHEELLPFLDPGVSTASRPVTRERQGAQQRR